MFICEEIFKPVNSFDGHNFTLGLRNLIKLFIIDHFLLSFRFLYVYIYILWKIFKFSEVVTQEFCV